MAKRVPSRAELNHLRARFPAVTSCSDDDLPSMWAALMLRMRERQLIRGHGSIPGELAEFLMKQWYDGELTPQSTRGVDVRTPLGRRVQVKALRYTDPGRNSVGSFTGPTEFDELAIVCFEYDMRVREALLLESGLLRLADKQRPGLLTPAGMRLTLGPHVREAATPVSADELWQRGGGARRDAEQTNARARSSI